MRNPFRRSPFAEAVLACEVVAVAAEEAAFVVDAVTVGPAMIGRRRLPKGSPFTLRFGSASVETASPVTRALLEGWQRSATAVDVAVIDSSEGVRCQMSVGPECLTVTLDSLKG